MKLAQLKFRGASAAREEQRSARGHQGAREFPARDFLWHHLLLFAIGRSFKNACGHLISSGPAAKAELNLRA
jgi:hypothetical protein